MSVAGRNMVIGSTLTVYRSTKTAGTGGQTNVSWAAVLTAVRWELHTLTAEMLEQVFGQGSQVELVAFEDDAATVLLNDGVVVTAGKHAGKKFRVHRTRLGRKYLEIGLKSTVEAIP